MIYKLIYFLIIASNFLYGCADENSQNISMGNINLSGSYIYPLKITLNEDGGIPGGGLAECAEHVGLNAIAHTTFTGKPKYVVVEWQYLLSNKTYHAKVMLDKHTMEWLKHPPFSNYDAKESSPALVVQWRGSDKVAVMLAVDFTNFSKGTKDLGEAEGVEIPKPDWAPNHQVTYENLRDSDYKDYAPGAIRNYDRSLDSQLSREQRFGCPRLPNGNIDVSKLPPEKLPFLFGENGEHVPCAEYFCADKEDLIKKLRNLDWRRYSEGQIEPAYVFQDAPNPRPAW